MGFDMREVDRIEVLTLMDNYVDMLLESTPVVTRPPRAKEGMISKDTLVGEHGLGTMDKQSAQFVPKIAPEQTEADQQEEIACQGEPHQLSIGKGNPAACIR